MIRSAKPLVPLLVIGLVGAAAYLNSFSGAFQFDDIPAILENPSIQSLRPLWRPLIPLPGALTVSGRPILNATLAINHAISGDAPWSYHAVNLAIHLGCALLLSGIVFRNRKAAGDPAAVGIATAVSLLWVVHPLNTESVTYVVQRAESLMGLFYLGAIYAFVRATEPGRPRPSVVRWLSVSWLACLLGAGTKEVIATAPLVISLYDVTFVSPNWRSAWRERRGYYLALGSTWIVLAALVASTGWDRGGTSGFRVGIAWWPYWRSQGEAILRYLGLSVWPSPLAIDYGPALTSVWLADLFCAVVVLGLGATVVGVARRSGAAFLAACFFLVLAPTSVMPGVLQFIAEHRMYLPLAAVLTAAVVGVSGLVPRLIGDSERRRYLGYAVLSAGVIALSAATLHRNKVYRSELDLWTDTIVKRPQSALAQANVGHAFLVLGMVDAALPYCRESVRLDPNKPTARFNLALAEEKKQHWAEALAQFEAAAQLNPKYWSANFYAGRLLNKLGRPAEAESELRQALAIGGDLAGIHANLGAALAAQSRLPEAIVEDRRALEMEPRQAEVDLNLGLTLERVGQAHEAIACYAAAVQLDPHLGQAGINLGVALARESRLPEALAALQAAAKNSPDLPEAHANLGLVFDQMERPDEAVPEFQRALQLKPDYADAHYNLGNALLHRRDLKGARAQFAEALRLKPGLTDARDLIEKIDQYELRRAGR